MEPSMTTLCYIEKDDQYLMLHRVKKEKDVNKDKWVGVGGHFEKDETPEECLLREVKEETGLILNSWKLRGIITFLSNEFHTEYMFLYTSNDYSGEMISCNEGNLEWVNKSDVYNLPIWEGDKIFLELLEKSSEFFSLKLRYEGSKLVEAVLNGDLKMNNRAQTYVVTKSNMEVRKSEIIETEIEGKVYRHQLIHFDDEEGNRIIFKDKNMNNIYEKGMVGTLYLRITEDNIIKTSTKNNQYIGSRINVQIENYSELGS